MQVCNRFNNEWQKARHIFQSGCKPAAVLLDDCHPATAMWITQCIHMARIFIPEMSGKIGGDYFGVTHSNLHVSDSEV